MKTFGLLKGLPHSNCNENFEDYKKYKNTIPKEVVLKYLESDKVEKCYGFMPPAEDMFTGERMECGLYEDGEYVIPMEFVHYYKNYDIGIPYDYEEYLKKILGL